MSDPRRIDQILAELDALRREVMDLKRRKVNSWVQNGSAGGSKFAAKLTASLASGTAAGTQIYSMDGMGISYLETVTIYDPLYNFDDLGAGDWLYCTKQDGKYYAADNARCPGDSPLIDTPPASGPPGEPV